MDLQLRGKVALVTAASKGLGKATVRQFARENAKIAICARSELIAKTAAEIESATGTEVLSLRADVTSQEDIK
ncbi:SDR family NAD(P)-dependent oxidoreductase [Nostoc sp.]|uniref:SDR family NAD(P)-dependent oxidoreductase n=1 Tax=Nostoc sp. TaxID=1180 RepID=UPI002FF7ABBA